MRGGIDDDRLYGQEGNDVLYGDSGSDFLQGDGDDDRLYGGSGNDTLNGGDSNDRLYGGSGIDYLGGNDGDDRLYGRSGIDNLYGGDGNDLLYGGSGNDFLHGMPGIDVLRGGKGNDSLIFDAADKEINGNKGIDTLCIIDGEDINLVNNKVTSHIEIITCYYGTLNLTLTRSDVLRISDSDSLRIFGTADITVHIENGWVLQDGQTKIDTLDYSIYKNGKAVLYVAQEVHISFESSDATLLSTVGTAPVLNF